MNTPSIKRMMAMLGIDKAKAQEIKRVLRMPEYGIGGVTAYRKLCSINSVLSTHGVEYIPKGKGGNSPAIRYCNTGETYNPTIMLIDGRFIIGSWGDWVEKGDYE